MKKLVIITLALFSFLASAKTSNIIIPPPSCNPCDWVR